MLFLKPHYFNTYAFSIKLLALLIFCFFFVSCNEKEKQQNLTVRNEVRPAEAALNINKASAEQLEKLPNIGEKLAQRIIEYREKYGGFRKIEHLMLVPGISESRFRQMRDLIKVE
jgi:competence ComEA-like helix-hairpin-helix protein